MHCWITRFIKSHRCATIPGTVRQHREEQIRQDGHADPERRGVRPTFQQDTRRLRDHLPGQPPVALLSDHPAASPVDQRFEGGGGVVRVAQVR